MWPLVLMGAGMVLNSYAKGQANDAQAKVEYQNAMYYRQQAQFAQEAGNREETIYKRKSDVQIGNQVGAFASGNVDVGSGSALDVLTQSHVQQLNEMSAIETQTQMRVNLAQMRANGADTNASNIQSSTGMTWLANGLAFGGEAAKSYSNNNSNSSGENPDLSGD